MGKSICFYRIFFIGLKIDGVKVWGLVENNFHWDDLLDKKKPLDYHNVKKGKLPELQAWMREE